MKPNCRCGAALVGQATGSRWQTDTDGSIHSVTIRDGPRVCSRTGRPPQECPA